MMPPTFTILNAILCLLFAMLFVCLIAYAVFAVRIILDALLDVLSASEDCLQSWLL
jgi:hypothetical protein